MLWCWYRLAGQKLSERLWIQILYTSLRRSTCLQSYRSLSSNCKCCHIQICYNCWQGVSQWVVIKGQKCNVDVAQVVTFAYLIYWWVSRSVHRPQTTLHCYAEHVNEIEELNIEIMGANFGILCLHYVYISRSVKDGTEPNHFCLESVVKDLNLLLLNSAKRIALSFVCHHHRHHHHFLTLVTASEIAWLNFIPSGYSLIRSTV